MNAADGRTNPSMLLDESYALIKIAATEKDVIEHGRNLRRSVCADQLARH
jgi:hypothetical protein